MKILKLSAGLLAFALGNISGCSGTSAHSPDISEIIRTSLHQAQSISRSFAGSQTVAGQITVIPPAMQSDASPVNPVADRGIEKNIGSRRDDGVDYAFKNGAATAEKVASGVPAVNELQGKDTKAGSSY
jgi:hypothetical protein